MRSVYIAITLLVTVIVAFEGYFKVTAVTTAAAEVKNWGIILSAFALGVAALGLLSLHIRRLLEMKRESIYSAALIGGLVWFGGVGLTMGTTSKAYSYFYTNLLQPTGNAVFSMLMFYIVTAAYRSFRVNRWQSMIVLAAAAFIMLGSVPIGEVISKDIARVSGWILRVPNTAGQRGIIIGSAIGGIAAALRAALGLERSR
jgi:hypothetical protein